MILQNLRMERVTYGADKGQMRGTAHFSNEHGKVEINLSDEMCKSILTICAMQIVDTAKHVARDLTADLIVGQALLAREEA
jgi:hypothetical protein